MKYYCKDCEEEFEVGEKDFIPSAGWEYDFEYLLFYVICPKCKGLSVYERCTSVNEEKIPPDMKLRLMKKYAYVSNDYIEYYKNLRDYIIAKKKCEKILERIHNKKELLKDDTKLFANWKDSETIVDNASKIQLKKTPTKKYW